MRNIAAVVVHDAKHLTKSAVVLIVLLGLCIVPCLYAWFNILSNWNPYEPEATGRLPFAVVSLDKGTKAFDVSINAGEKMIEALKASNGMGWVFVDDKAKAIKGVRSGKYYAAFVIPKHFSKDLLSFSKGRLKHPRIHYYENEKKNAIAPKITGKAETALQEQVNAAFLDTLGSYVAESARAAKSMGLETGDVFTELGDRLKELSDSLGDSVALLNTASSLSDSSKNMLAASDSLVTGSENTLKAGNNALSYIDGRIPDPDGPPTTISGSFVGEDENGMISGDATLEVYDSRVRDARRSAKAAIRRTQASISGTYGDLRALNGVLHNAESSLSTLKGGIGSTTSQLQALQQDCGELAAMFYRLSDSGLVNDVNKLLGVDEQTLAQKLASPIKMESKTIYPIKNYGSAMASFYTILAQWVGALLAAVLIHAHVKPDFFDRRMRLHEQFFGRYLLFAFVGLAQALIVAAGDLFYLEIQCKHPVLFILAACINGLVFAAINYALVFALDKAGLGASVIILVLQVAGTGGTFPIEVLPPVFKALFPFMPFHYALDAMRDCIAGLYKNTYAYSMLMLCLFAAAAIAFGLIMYYPSLRLTRMIAERMKKSGIML